MRSNFTQLYVHCVWATWDRLPLITPDIQPAVYAAIIQPCKDLKCTVIALGGIEDHIHLLVGIPPTLCISDLIKAVKGSSSHFITHKLQSDSPSDRLKGSAHSDRFFKWQGSYGAFTVSHSELDRAANYIKNQAIHHQQKSLIKTWELEPSN